MVEVASDSSRVQSLAVCLGRFNNYDHFYSSSGRWFTHASLRTFFTTSNFAEPAEIQSVIDEIPDINAPIEVLETMQDVKEGPSRAAGAKLLAKMARFQTESEKVHQLHATDFDNAFDTLSKSDKRNMTASQVANKLSKSDKKYMTVSQIANILLNPKLKRDVDLPPHCLYAVHKVLFRNDVCFRALGTLGNEGRDWMYEISAPYDVALINNIQTLVRMFHEVPERVHGPLKVSYLKESQLGRFILKARDAIDHSRKSRDWTPHGMIGPSSDADPPKPVWSNVDASILHFMQMWSSHDHFSPTSSFHWIGSAILRAVERYHDSEYLDTTAGWTFLQEIGWIAPWDLHARYSMRLPGVGVKRTGGFNRSPLAKEFVKAELRGKVFTQDVFKGKRKDFAGIRAYAIDADASEDIDDAVSLEPTSEPGEHWVHVHVADPASSITPNSIMSERARLVPSSVYLSGFYENMWGCSDVGQVFSLAPGRRCLTFSGKVNDDGALLEYKITPGTLGEVIYMNPNSANEVVGHEKLSESEQVAREPFTVGRPPVKQSQPTRKMTTPSELSQENTDELQTLDRLAKALQDVRLAKGAFPGFLPKPHTEVSMEHAEIRESMAGGNIICIGDPFISISNQPGEGVPLVNSTMRMACEIAARWCADRNIPIPYVSQPTAQKNIDLLKAYAEKNYYPTLARGERPSLDQLIMMRALMGSDEVSTTPGSYFIVGADMYAKATSPLRRFSDLIVHWQIESALLQEYEKGGEGPVKESNLPFSAQELDTSILPMLRLRECTLRTLFNHHGDGQWILQALVRAWKFGDKEPWNSKLPETFKFTVENVLGKHVIRGRLDWFERTATMAKDSLPPLGVVLANIRRGDVFEVKLRDVNVHGMTITVDAVAKPEARAAAEVKEVGVDVEHGL